MHSASLFSSHLDRFVELKPPKIKKKNVQWINKKFPQSFSRLCVRHVCMYICMCTYVNHSSCMQGVCAACIHVFGEHILTYKHAHIHTELYMHNTTVLSLPRQGLDVIIRKPNGQGLHDRIPASRYIFRCWRFSWESVTIFFSSIQPPGVVWVRETAKHTATRRRMCRYSKEGVVGHGCDWAAEWCRHEPQLELCIFSCFFMYTR
jgi:hypothetical protein